MVNTKDLTEKPVKKSCGKYSLPEADEMEGEGNSLEILVLLYCLQYFRGCLYGIKYGEYP